MSNILRRNQDKVTKTKKNLKQSGTSEMSASRWLMENKENTPPVTRSKSRTVKSINKSNVLSIPSVKTKTQEKKNEFKGDFSRRALTPVKVKPVAKHTKNCKMILNESPIHRPKSVSNSERNDASHYLLPVEETLVDNSFASKTLLPAEETNDDSLPSVSHIVFRRKSSNAFEKEACMLTTANPPLEYWKMLAEQRLSAIDNTLYQNELMYDQLSVLVAENSQLKDTLKKAQDMIMVIKTSF